jgi:DNA invertase Pin-like site-specific DNA recombinase
LKVLAGAGAQIDTTTANGRLVFGIFAALAEFETELIRERTKAGLRAARARGRHGGRPRKMTATTLKMAMTAMAESGSQAKKVASRLGITTSTLYAYVNGDGSPKELGQRLLDNKKHIPSDLVVDSSNRARRLFTSVRTEDDRVGLV